MPVFQLADSPFFPPPDLAREDGLLAVGGDLSPERLLIAYQMGIFPWYSAGEPILWWAPDPRLVLFPDEFRISRRLSRTIRKNHFEISADTRFREVIESCAGPRKTGDGTWIVPDMVEAYCRLHEIGFAHSIECSMNGKLAGGLYGVAIGSIYFGESMFSSEKDASKIALAYLVTYLKNQGYDLIDCQIPTDHLKSMGAREIPGNEFYKRLEKAVTGLTRRGKWQCHDLKKPAGIS